MIDRPALARRVLAEFLGTGLLVTVIVGSGIAAQQLSIDVGLQLLGNSTATALGLAVLIVLLGPISGAHFNPLVSVADAILGRRTGAGLPVRDVTAYIGAQVAGGIGGAVLANLMFQVPLAIASTARVTAGTLLGEVTATAGLVLLITGLTRMRQSLPVIATAVGAYIGAAYWFTSSTSFANPAVTIGRIFTDTFAGIAPESVLPFIAAEVFGAAIGVAAAALLFPLAAQTGAHTMTTRAPEAIMARRSHM